MLDQLFHYDSQQNHNILHNHSLLFKEFEEIRVSVELISLYYLTEINEISTYL